MTDKAKSGEAAADEPRSAVTRTEEASFPAGGRVEVLNPDWALPAVVYVSGDALAGGVMPVLLLRDMRQAVVFPGHWGALVGLDLAEAAVSNLSMIDSAAYTALRERAEDLLQFIRLMPATGTVREPGALQ